MTSIGKTSRQKRRCMVVVEFVQKGFYENAQQRWINTGIKHAHISLLYVL